MLDGAEDGVSHAVRGARLGGCFLEKYVCLASAGQPCGAPVATLYVVEQLATLAGRDFAVHVARY
jgi:hypothetical protein